MIMCFKSRIQKVLWPSLCVAFFIAVFVPINAYVSNIQEFPAVRPEMLLSVAGLIFLFFALCLTMSLGLIRSRAVLSIALSSLIGLMIALYVQGNVINLDYGVLDGRTIPWEQMRTAGLLNTAVWMLAIGVFVFTSLKFRSFFLIVLPRFVQCFLAYMVLITVMRFFTCTPPAEFPVEFSYDHFGTLSSESNLVVIIVDSLDRSLMDKFLKENPEYRDKLSDFTYYHNVIGRFPLTHFALPHIVTGVPDDGKLNYSVYKNNAYLKSETMSAWRENGYSMSVYANTEFAPSYEVLRNCKCIDNGLHRDYGLRDGFNGWILTLNSSMFGYLPHFLKRYHERFYLPQLRTSGFVGPNLNCKDVEKRFFDYVQNGKFTFSDGKKVKIYHLMGTHLPEFTVEKLRVCLDAILSFSSMLKDHGAWEKTQLVVLADHGQIRRETPSLLCNNARGGFTICDDPVSYADLPKIFVSALSGKICVPCAKGLRPFYFDKFYDDIGNEIVDSSKAKNSYSGHDLMLLSNRNIETESRDRNCWLWTLGTDCRLGIPLPNNCNTTDVQVSVVVWQALLGPQHPEFNVTVRIGDDEVHRQKFTYGKHQGVRMSFVVPARLNLGGMLPLSVQIDKPTSPNALRPNYGDYRKLGLQIGAIEVQPCKFKEACNGFVFAHASPCYSFSAGFANPEPPHGCWTDGTNAVLTLRMPEHLKGKSVTTSIKYHAFIRKGKLEKQRVVVAADGICAHEGVVEGETVQAFNFSFSPEMTKDGVVELKFTLPDAASPSELGVGNDPRKLAIFLRSCKMELVE